MLKGCLINFFGYLVHASPAASSTNPAGLPARQAALHALQAIFWRGQPLDPALDYALAPISDARDRAFVHALVAATLRHCIDIDARIDALTQKPLPKDARARLVLRLSLAQACVLATPAHAVVSTALPLVERGPRRLVHALLSKLLKNPEPLPMPPSLPAAFTQSWTQAYGAQAVHEIAQVLGQIPPLDLTLKEAGQTDYWAARLGGLSVMPGHIRLRNEGLVKDLPGFAEGAWWVQDIAASLAVRLLDPQRGENVLDLCAAPGGKTLQLAALGAKVTAVEGNAKRMQRVQENLARLGLSADCVVSPLEHFTPKQKFSAILLDAPCSATGTARRNPDVLHTRQSQDLTPLLAQQAAFLARALDWLEPGGRLIYAVCSLEAAEGEAQIDALCAKRQDVALDPIEPQTLGALSLAGTQQGFVRTLPCHLAPQGGMDGFFMARLIKK
jgi:16S rRNA (cytosine967-C5)-methyltransferase